MQIRSPQIFRSRWALPFCLAFFSVFWVAKAGAETKDPGPFYGFWEMPEPAGDHCVVNVKRGGRVSCFWIGSAVSRVMKGEWRRTGDELTVTWETGHQDVFTRIGDNALNRDSYLPGQAPKVDNPAFQARAVKVDPRLPGSLTVAGTTPPASSADTAAESPLESPPPAATPTIPLRNPYVGYWEVEQNPGGFFGIGGSGMDRFYLQLGRNGRASVALRRWSGSNTAHGDWEIVNGEARITWPSGLKDALVEEDDGSFRLLSYSIKRDFGDRPDNRRQARSAPPNTAAQYFNAGDVRLLTMTDIRGTWAPVDPQLITAEPWIVVEGWGNAALRSPAGNVLKRGNWKLFNDRFVVTWEDGSKDLLRNDLQRWTRDQFPPGEPVTGTPSSSYTVNKMREDRSMSTTANEYQFANP